MAHASGDRAYDGVCKTEQLSCNAARIHEIAHEDKERAGKHGKGVSCLCDSLDNDHRLIACHEDVQE
jgi:hypothetical protein